MAYDILIQYVNTKVEVIEDAGSAEKAVETLLRERVVGFDTETRPNFVRGERNDTALVQLASRDRAYLFRVKHLGGISPLIPLLESAETIKAGLAMDRDIKVSSICTTSTFSALKTSQTNHNIFESRNCKDCDGSSPEAWSRSRI